MSHKLEEAHPLILPSLLKKLEDLKKVGKIGLIDTAITENLYPHSSASLQFGVDTEDEEREFLYLSGDWNPQAKDILEKASVIAAPVRHITVQRNLNWLFQLVTGLDFPVRPEEYWTWADYPEYHHDRVLYTPKARFKELTTILRCTNRVKWIAVDQEAYERREVKPEGSKAVNDTPFFRLTEFRLFPSIETARLFLDYDNKRRQLPPELRSVHSIDSYVKVKDLADQTGLQRELNGI